MSRADRGGPFRVLLDAVVVAVLEERLGEPPEGIGREPEREKNQEELAAAFVGNRRKRTFPARRLASLSSRQGDREASDDREGDPFCKETYARESRHPLALGFGLELAGAVPDLPGDKGLVHEDGMPATQVP